MRLVASGELIDLHVVVLSLVLEAQSVLLNFRRFNPEDYCFLLFSKFIDPYDLGVVALDIVDPIGIFVLSISTLGVE